MHSTNANERIELLQKSAKFFPFERRLRVSTALFLGQLALEPGNNQLKEFAIPELKKALLTDPTQADVLAVLVVCDFALRRDEEGHFYFEQFKRVAVGSPMIKTIQSFKDARK